MFIREILKIFKKKKQEEKKGEKQKEFVNPNIPQINETLAQIGLSIEDIKKPYIELTDLIREEEERIFESYDGVEIRNKLYKFQQEGLVSGNYQIWNKTTCMCYGINFEIKNLTTGKTISTPLYRISKNEERSYYTRLISNTSAPLELVLFF